MRQLVQNKKTYLAVACALAVGLAVVLATVAFAQQAGSRTANADQVTDEVQLLSELEPNAFPAEGKVNASVDVVDTPKGTALKALQEGDGVTVTDYVQGFFQVETDEGRGYVEQAKLDVSFAQPLSAEVIQSGQIMTEKQAHEDSEALPLVKGYFVRVAGCEGAWCVLETSGEPTYVKTEMVSFLPQIAKRFDKAGEYGTDSVEVIKGSVVVSADDVVLKNMVIEGNLYLLEEVSKITLRDAYVSHATFLHGDAVEIDSNMDKVASGVGSPSEIVSEMFRKNYPEVDEDELEQDMKELISNINDAVYAD